MTISISVAPASMARDISRIRLSRGYWPDGKPVATRNKNFIDPLAPPPKKLPRTWSDGEVTHSKTFQGADTVSNLTRVYTHSSRPDKERERERGGKAQLSQHTTDLLSADRSQPNRFRSCDFTHRLKGRWDLAHKRCTFDGVSSPESVVKSIRLIAFNSQCAYREWTILWYWLHRPPNTYFCFTIQRHMGELLHEWAQIRHIHMVIR